MNKTPAANGPNGKFFRVMCPDCDVPMILDGTVGSLWEDQRRYFRCDELRDPEDDSKPLEACMQDYRDGDPLPVKSGVAPQQTEGGR